MQRAADSVGFWIRSRGSGYRAFNAQRLATRRHFWTRTRTQGSEWILNAGGGAGAGGVATETSTGAILSVLMGSTTPGSCLCKWQYTLRSSSLRLQFADRPHGTWAAALQHRWKQHILAPVCWQSTHWYLVLSHTAASNPLTWAPIRWMSLLQTAQSSCNQTSKPFSEVFPMPRNVSTNLDSVLQSSRSTDEHCERDSFGSSL